MEGQVNIDALKVRQSENKLNPSDHPMLGLIALADLEIEQIINSQNTQELKNQLEGAGNYLPANPEVLVAEQAHFAAVRRPAGQAWGSAGHAERDQPVGRGLRFGAPGHGPRRHPFARVYLVLLVPGLVFSRRTLGAKSFCY
jgi:hypothetical protein